MTKHINGQAGKQGVTDLQRRIACLRRRIRELEECVKRRNDEIHELRVANAKLRVLMFGLKWCSENYGCEDVCPLYDKSEPEHCRDERLLRELGVEVDV